MSTHARKYLMDACTYENIMSAASQSNDAGKFIERAFQRYESEKKMHQRHLDAVVKLFEQTGEQMLDVTELSRIL